MSEIHIERCACCGGNINALHKPSFVQDHAGRYYHNTSYCLPADARSRAEALWGNVFTFTSGDGLASR
jgi:hypothetical protein